MMSEFAVAFLLVVLPLIAGGSAWFKWEFNKSESAYYSFARAREELIRTGKRSHFQAGFGEMSENVELYTLEELDQGPEHLSISDLGREASQHWADASLCFQQLQELASSKSFTELKP